MKSILFSIILFVSLFACQENEGIQPTESLVIKSGETKTFEINGKSLTISVSKIDDSRCPEDVVCIWAGANVVTLTAEMGNNTSGATGLCSNCESYNDFPPASFQFENYKITLLDSKPYNKANETSTTKSAYLEIESLK